MTNNENFIKLNNVRIVYPVLFEADSYKSDDGVEGLPRFSVRFIVDKTKNAQEINNINTKSDLLLVSHKMTRERLSAKGSKHLVLKDPFSVKTYLEAYDNSFIINASSSADNKPVLFEKDGKTRVNDQNRFYSGCYVNAYISLRFTTKHDMYLGANLHAVQFLNDGEQIGGVVFNPEGMFDSVIEESSLNDIDVPF